MISEFVYLPMKYLTVFGEKKRIPGYPHHKDLIYRVRQFFEVKSIYSFISVDGNFRMLKELWLNWRYNTIAPKLLMIDPTSACNLTCKGCWAADYKKHSHLSYEKLDELFTDAKKIGVLEILFTGGEPLLRKTDILKLCAKHNKLTFGAFTNGTMIDEPFADNLAKLGNLNVFISIEGFREETDFRRGEGTFDKVITAMEILKSREIGFGFSVCYHARNYLTVSSDEFLDFLREKGAWFGWMFLYMPIGRDADISLCCSADQRAYVRQKIKDYSARHDFPIIDFANSGHKAFGCVSSADGFAHINAEGDLEPCAFFHYSDANIHNMSLARALRSPLFRKFRKLKPFSDNPLKPCPIMDVPDAMLNILPLDGVHSTHLDHPESPEELMRKTRPAAAQWEPVAQKLYDKMPADERKRFITMTKILSFWHTLQPLKPKQDLKK